MAKNGDGDGALLAEAAREVTGRGALPSHIIYLD